MAISWSPFQRETHGSGHKHDKTGAHRHTARYSARLAPYSPPKSPVTTLPPVSRPPMSYLASLLSMPVQIQYLNGSSGREGGGGGNGQRLGLENLPRELIDLISWHVGDYETLLNLRRTCRAMYQTVDAQLADYDNKVGFVRNAEQYFRQHWPRGNRPPNFGCYDCFRVRSPHYFTAEWASPELTAPPGQAMQMTRKPRRRCIACGVAAGIHRPGERLETHTGQRCWVCKCGTQRDVNAPAPEIECARCGARYLGREPAGPGFGYGG